MRTRSVGLLLLAYVPACDAFPYELDLGGDKPSASAAAAQPPATGPSAAAQPPATGPSAAASRVAAVTPAGSVAKGPREPAPGPVVDITKDAVGSVTTTSEQDKFPARNLFDQNPKTAWVEDSPSDGEGHWVEVTLVPGTYLDHVEVSAGWGSETRFKEDLWEINSSVRVMKVSWDTGEATVDFVRSTDRGKKKRVDINARTTKVRFTAEAVAVGKFEELAIDDHNLFGVLAAR